MTDLVIVFPFREYAEEIQKDLKERSIQVDLVHGYLSDTYGIKIEFINWYKDYRIGSYFILGERLFSITGFIFNEIPKYEVLPGDCVYVPDHELISIFGKYKLSDNFCYSVSEDAIYFKDSCSKRLSFWEDRGYFRDKEFRSGVRKLIRRGFLETWLTRLVDIAEY